MAGDFPDSYNLAEIENISFQPLGHPRVGMEKIQLFEAGLSAVGTDDLPRLQANPDSLRTKVQVPDPATLLAVSPNGLPSPDMAEKLESLVGDCLQVTLLAIAGDPLAEDMDSWEGEIVGYTPRGDRRSPLDGNLERRDLYYLLEIPDVNSFFKHDKNIRLLQLIGK